MFLPVIAAARIILGAGHEKFCYKLCIWGSARTLEVDPTELSIHPANESTAPSI